ncbi:Ferric enterobactin transport system permease protein FepG [Arthrobacter saudimassiliensis]|uniref:Ferric enterobactin transport system permease protein FepG n=1 Tax=Arthrobacter saudimassiliensis TaxID=1461584 RepID=A0A078MWU9_9MICC|nr:Ferric enterobactin transport system permease protein FepG [Arthrobacter saudimassiliensis]
MSIGTSPRRIGPAPDTAPGAGPSPIVSPRVLALGPVRLRVSARTAVVGFTLAAAAALLAVLSMQTGTLALAFGDVVAAVFGNGEPGAQAVVQRIRLPRTVTALAVGACLGAAGATFQSISRNALGSPDIIGFTTGAATGAVAQIVLFNGGPLATAGWAVGGGLAAAAAVYLLSLRGGVTGGYRLVLIGIGVGAMLSALNTVLLAKGDSDLAAQAHLWLSGSLAARTWAHALPVLAAVGLLLPLLLGLGRKLSLMEMGEDAARALGIRTERVRITAMAAAVGLTALATAAAGPIAFVALAAPQLAARLTRSPGVPIGTGALMGAVLMVGSDLLTQHLPIQAAVPIGLMTGLVGGIYLLWLLTRSRQV